VSSIHEDLFITSFDDAVGVVLGLYERFGTAHAVAALDSVGRVCDLTAFTNAADSIDTDGENFRSIAITLGDHAW
jgi:hypothetical protein